MIPVMVLMSFFVCGQRQTMIVGEKIPRIIFDKLYNTAYSKLDIGKIKDKIVILDFWSTKCGACLKQTPKVAALQKKFKEELVIVMVTAEKKAIVEQFFERRPELKKLGMPVAYEAGFMDSLMTIPYFPYLAWIDQEKVLHRLTDGDDLTASNIKALSEGKSITINTKDKIEFEYGENLLSSIPEHIHKVKYSSNVFDSITNSGARQWRVDFDSERMHILCINLSVYRLYASAYRYKIRFSQRPENLIINRSIKIRGETMYCYELIYLKDRYEDEDAFDIMQQDLDKAFGIKSEVMKLQRKVYVVKIGDSSKLRKATARDHVGHVGFSEINNLRFGQLSNTLAERVPTALPIICDGDINRIVNFQIKNSYSNLEELRKDLNEYGIDIYPDEREIDCLVLSDGIK